MPIDARRPELDPKWLIDAANLRELIGSEGWETLVGYAGKAEHDETERLLNGPAERAEYQKGYIMGLRRALHLPTEVIRGVDAARDAAGNNHAAREQHG